MHAFKFRNVNDGFHRLVKGFHREEFNYRQMNSRNGEVLSMQEPVVWQFTHPRERVLFNRARDCNPFFHLYEAMWMLAGRNDVDSLAFYNRNMKQFSDDGETFWGAYGARWRHWFKIDQLRVLCSLLKEEPDTRRAILTMWDGEHDLVRFRYGPSSKDIPCNMYCKFRIANDFLDMTVHNRSNDLIWGATGANPVHFSFLQEYVAARTHKKVGRLYVISDDLHIYTWNWKPLTWLQDITHNVYLDNIEIPPLMGTGTEIVTFDQDVSAFATEPTVITNNYFLNHVGRPMMRAFEAHKARDYESAFKLLKEVRSYDWRVMSEFWISKRKQIWEELK